MPSVEFGPDKNERHQRRCGLRPKIDILLELIGLLAFLSSMCLGSPSPKPVNCIKHGSTAETEIPFRIYKGVVIVRATIGTMKKMNMVLDTGTNPSAISQELADRLKVQGTKEPLQTMNGTIHTESVILPCIQIGPLDASPIRVVVLQNLRFVERNLGITIGGIAGLDILGTRSFTIDYRRKKIVFGPIGHVENAVRFETQRPVLTVRVMIEGHPVRLMVSGVWGVLVYRDRLATRLERISSDSNGWINGIGRNTPIRWFRARVSLGEGSLGSRNVAIAEVDSGQNDFDGLLGFAQMGFRKLSFDFENGIFGWE